MKLLVLGGSGFIGKHFIDSLLDSGHHVTNVDVAAVPSDSTKDVTHVVGTHEDRALIEPILAEVDCVCQLISTTVPANSNENVVFDIESNLIANIRLLEMMRETSVRRFLYLSSGGTVYGHPEQYPITETHALNPISSYGVVKVAVEKYLQMYQEIYGFEPVIIRPANAFGPGQSTKKPQGVMAHFLARLQQSLPIQVWGDGEVRRDYIYVTDLTKLMVQAIESNRTGIYNAGSGTDASVNEIIEALAAIHDCAIDIERLPSRSHDVARIRLDIEKANHELGWKPETDLAVGIRAQYDWAMESDTQGH